MTTQTEALKLALEALEYYDKPLKEYSAKTARDKDFKAIAAIKEALAQPEQEPVAWMNPYGGVSLRLFTGLEKNSYTIPLYTAPPQRTWVELTVDEMVDLVRNYRDVPATLVGETEAKLKAKNERKEKNNGFS